MAIWGIMVDVGVDNWDSVDTWELDSVEGWDDVADIVLVCTLDFVMGETETDGVVVGKQSRPTSSSCRHITELVFQGRQLREILAASPLSSAF